MRGYLIEKYTNMGSAYTCYRLIDEAKKKDIELIMVGIYDLCETEDGVLDMRNGKLLTPCDFVINRYKWGHVKDAVNALAKKSYNSLDAFNRYINKYEQVKNLSSEAFLIPKYLMGNALLPFDRIRDRLGLPFVAKGLESSMGEEILLIEGQDDYEKLKRSYGSGKEWLFEEFIHTSFGRDMRFYSIRGEVTACMERRSQGDFRANVALGGSVRPLEVTEQMRRTAQDIYRETGLDFLGIDLLYGKDLPYLCEINVMPGLEGIEGASGLNIAEKIIDTIRGDF